MSELAVMLVSRELDDPYTNARAYKRGDVIIAVEDGWSWGRAELTHPDWVILQIPALSLQQAAAFLGSEQEINPVHPSKVLQRRAYYLDLDRIPEVSGARGGKIFLNYSGKQILNMRQRRLPLTDPNIL